MTACVPPGRGVTCGARRTADRRRQPRRGPGAAVDGGHRARRRARPGSLGGRDELSGGTWLAVNEHGVCAGLTNQPLGDAKDPSKRSRGELPLALARHATAADAVDALLSALPPGGLQRLAGSSSVTAPRSSSSTSPARPAARPVSLPPGIHVLENRALGEPSPKVDLVRAAARRPGRRRRRWPRPSAACWPTTGSPRATSARTPPTACTSTRSGRGRRAWCGWPPATGAAPHVGGRRAPVHDALRGRQRLWARRRVPG